MSAIMISGGWHISRGKCPVTVVGTASSGRARCSKLAAAAAETGSASERRGAVYWPAAAVAASAIFDDVTISERCATEGGCLEWLTNSGSQRPPTHPAGQPATYTYVRLTETICQ